MLMMRLQRVGRKNNPAYRVVVVDKRASTKSNKTIDLIGNYNPKLGQITINAEKAKHWLAQGVQASDTVHNMLVSQKVIEGKKRNALPKKSPIIDEAKLKAEAEAKEKAEADRLAAIEAEKAAAAAAEEAANAPVEEVAAEETPVVATEEVKEEVAA
ncbi:30S ribosomal protein S16 [Patescibacteria group bacterium]|nr:30S ribosomal protein S16 [Patescibacteria group bacterium]